MKYLWKWGTTLIGVLLLTQMAWAQADDSSVILTISGLKTPYQGKYRVKLTRADLLKLPQQTFTTANPWVDQPHQYRGPLLADVLKKYGITSTRLVLVALNDYRITMDFSSVERFEPILAWSDNGETMTVRNHGPLWLMFPIDRFSELEQPVYNSYMIWQLRRIIVAN